MNRRSVSRVTPAARGVRRRRAALSTAALALIVSILVLAHSAGSGNPGSRHAGDLTQRSGVVSRPRPRFYGGEPDLRQSSPAPRAASKAASRFVRNYKTWSEGRLARLSAKDATGRVIALLERRGRAAGAATAGVAATVRLAPLAAHKCVVTSPVGNFLIGKRGSGWRVISLPGD
jgi:hypothetical protein